MKPLTPARARAHSTRSLRFTSASSILRYRVENLQPRPEGRGGSGRAVECQQVEALELLLAARRGGGVRNLSIAAHDCTARRCVCNIGVSRAGFARTLRRQRFKTACVPLSIMVWTAKELSPENLFSFDVCGSRSSSSSALLIRVPLVKKLTSKFRMLRYTTPACAEIRSVRDSRPSMFPVNVSMPSMKVMVSRTVCARFSAMILIGRAVFG